ncbi:phospholipase A [Pseudobacteriovorax antillogorgiicola]|uniref:Phosphatidylcholine 1-acylhydrolase n=1 Tax=Pseudobacteriovorax antillogorgiicola TaxID=1513793 RepID=A0A1Y6CLA7_9BACT|nr:phospholipase A [Pseudobacteriovorax antillogorgiicola]TCS45403.1 phospholipase A1-like protein [Pseudobacteriovorax antillogorgiicola]SMF73911.1 Phospholipase A1 [Pseudobacteriovorax antillogorgiicola]
MTPNSSRRLLIWILFLNLSPSKAWAVQGMNTQKNRVDDTEDLIINQMREEQAENIYRLRDVYMLGGNPNTKVQLSAKFKLLKSQPLYFGYTQKMFWDLLRKDSNPFRDITYNPEIFYTQEMTASDSSLKFLSVGLDHRSNGKAEEESRAYNAAFVQGDGRWKIADIPGTWSLRLQNVFSVDKTNPDIREHIGFWEARVSVADLFGDRLAYKVEAYLNVFAGGPYGVDLSQGGQELGFKFRTRIFGFFPYLMFQVYYGHKESLLEYQDYTKAYRFGILL